MSFKIKSLILIIAVLAPLFAAAALAQAAFREDFTNAYYANRHDYLAALVKKNKATVPSEVKALVQEALQGEKTFQERMQLLDAASAMASMHKYWNNDDKPLKEVETVQQGLINKENARIAEAQKWASFEAYPGNVLMKGKQKELEIAGLPLVVFPHWVHRLWYGCSACHNRLFVMKRGETAINQLSIIDGRYCGACHDGKTAFGAAPKEECVRCHNATMPPPVGLYDPSKPDFAKINETGARAGAPWAADKLKENKLPLDKLKFIDWTELRNRGAYEPTNLGEKNEIRKNAIVFTPRIQGINRVFFNHETHSKDSACSACHPGVFKETLGGDSITMTDMAEGKFCGACHGKTAFRFADCKRCHSVKPGEKPEGKDVLAR